MKAQIKTFNGASLPIYGTPDSAGFDIAANENLKIEPNEIKLVKTGLVIEAPEGYFLAVFSRSSTPRKKGLSFPHSVGIIDRDYCGPDDELLIQVYNFTKSTVEILKGDRIAQGIFLPVEQVEWKTVEKLGESTRGGFGSTS